MMPKASIIVLYHIHRGYSLYGLNVLIFGFYESHAKKIKNFYNVP